MPVLEIMYAGSVAQLKRYNCTKDALLEGSVVN